VSVIRNFLDDRESWPAVGAVNEGIPVAPVSGVLELSQAVFAGSQVRGNEGLGLPFLLAGADLESLVTHRRKFSLLKEIQNSLRREMLRETGYEASDRLARPLDLDQSALRGIGNPAAQKKRLGIIVDRGSEANPLHPALDR
jgi:hypothetical protein